VGEKQLPLSSVKQLIRKVTANFHLPYLTLSPTFSICPEHGYIFGEHPSCPKCAAQGKEQECTVFSRIVGYLRPVSHWNEGKQEEFRQRRLFDKGGIEKEPGGSSSSNKGQMSVVSEIHHQ
jgi:ribonucleoside-triphosphate reductase